MSLVILDRDGVINADSDDYIKSPREWHAIPGSIEAIARLHQAGWRIAVATNQSGIGRGLFDLDTLHRIHETFLHRLAELGGRIECIAFCPHTPDDHCGCRKPAPGLLHEIRRRLGVDLHGVPMIGDSRRDIEAALAVGGRPIHVRTGKGERTLAEGPLPAGIDVHPDLAAAVDALLG